MVRLVLLNVDGTQAAVWLGDIAVCALEHSRLFSVLATSRSLFDDDVDVGSESVDEEYTVPVPPGLHPKSLTRIENYLRVVSGSMRKDTFLLSIPPSEFSEFVQDCQTLQLQPLVDLLTESLAEQLTRATLGLTKMLADGDRGRVSRDDIMRLRAQYAWLCCICTHATTEDDLGE